MYKKNDVNFIVMDLLLLLYGLESFFPPITAFSNSSVVSLISLLGVVFVMFITDRDYFISQNIRNTYPLVLWFIMAVLPYLFGIGVIGNRYLSLGLIPLGYFIFNYYKKYNRLCELKIIVLALSMFIAITFIVTLKALIINPYVSRSIKSSGEYSMNLARQGIGGYHFIYFIVIAGQFLLYIFLKSKSAFIKIFTFVLYLFTLFFILKSSYMTALLIALIASGVMLISNYSGKGIANKAMMVVVVLIFILTIVNIDFITEQLSHFLPNRILNIVDNGESGILQSIFDEFLNDRFPVMKESVVKAITYPVIGLLTSKELSVGNNGMLVGFGQHSYILDTFALYGLAIGTVNIFVILKPFFDVNGKRIKYGKALNNSMIVCLLGIYLFNNATQSTAFGFCLIYPLIRELYKT